MSVLPTTPLERAIQRNDADLYRLALLLTPDQSSAARSLLSATRQLAVAAPALDEAALIGALVAALPQARHDQRARRPPAWTQRSAQAPLLAALVRLPREHLLVLGLTMLRAYEPAQVARLLGGAEADVRAQLRDALLALAPHAGLEHVALLDQDVAPEECRLTRAALALDEARLPTDPALRRHLAVCTACRAAEQAWLKLTNTVEDALRGALRDERLPNQLAEQLRAAAQPPAASARARLLADSRVRIALVLLPVLGLIAALVWPRGAPQPGTVPQNRTVLSQAPAPLELVRRAQAQLYIAPTGHGVWHSSYAIQWVFPGNLAAPLVADLWIEPASGRHRLQLVHQAGGGPYEYELADAPDSTWYAISQIYRSSIYLLDKYKLANLVHLRTSADQRQRMLQARLQSGAWDIAANYLRQAAGADLHQWGRQRDPDGHLVDLISFDGVSPLALPADAATATTSHVTIVLAIDEIGGRLREVRELLGAVGAEQTTRTTWRLVNEEWLDDAEALNRAFNQRLAWNGVGAFVERTTLPQPALPLIDEHHLVALARSLTGFGPPTQLLAAPPQGASAALLINTTEPVPSISGQLDGSPLAMIYFGGHRQLEVFVAFTDQAGAPLVGGEANDLGGRQLFITPGVGQVYQAQLTIPTNYGGPPQIVRIGARGYTRAELLDLLGSLRPATLEAYRAHARLLADPFSHTQAFDALVGALDRAAPAGMVRHMVERITARQDGLRDQLPDPYHQPRYVGQTEQTVRESWRRGTIGSATFAISATIRNSDQTVSAREYNSADQSWFYAPALDELNTEAASTQFRQIGQYPEQRLIVNMLACGGAQLQPNADGTRTLFLSDSGWQTGSCQHLMYQSMLESQTSPIFNEQGDQLPYLADIADRTLTTWIDLDSAGQAIRAEVRAGTLRSGILLEGWELLSSEQLPAAQAPADVFNPSPPNALIHWHNDIFNSDAPPIPHEITITDTLAIMRTPIFAFAEAITDTTTATPPPALAPLTINGVEPSIAPHPRWFYSDLLPFQGALLDAYALRVNIRLASGDAHQVVDVYEGEATRFGGYLRAAARWRSSMPVALHIRGRFVNGWQVVPMLPNPELWTLFELDGTLLAINLPPEQLDAALVLLRPIERQ